MQEVREGRVSLGVPEQADAGIGDDVFFNPTQELNRDVTVAALRAAEDRLPHAETYLDATAASGVRGVRAAAEGWTATLCDIDDDATDLCRENLARNDLEAEVVRADANVLLHERGHAFDVVDLDPFGTPIPFADAAVSNTKHLCCVTATDLAPLCGAHFQSGVRRYGTVPRNTEYHSEMGLRVLLSALVRTAARYDVAATPILSHASDHYARTYLELSDGAGRADDCIDQLGHVYHCEHCLWREHEFGPHADAPDRCPECEYDLKTAGPIYLGRPHDPDFVAATRAAVDDAMGTSEKARDLLATVEGEFDAPTHYDQHRLCKRWGEPAIGMDAFLEQLRAAGHDASRTHYGGTTFKTDADVVAVREAVEF
jgi:tRNA (guanine26-N2/guanine27-N2)-dimethyltransferase